MCREQHYIMGWAVGIQIRGKLWRFARIFGSLWVFWGETVEIRGGGDPSGPSRRRLSVFRQTSQVICPGKVLSEIIFLEGIFDRVIVC
jgi:hypothetical protein